MILKVLRPTINVIKCATSNVRSYRTECEKIESALSVLSINASLQILRPPNENNNVKFSAKTIIHNPSTPLFPVRPNILEIPIIKIPNVVPRNKTIIINDILPLINDLDCPTNGDVIEKKAERLIIQRRKKMKKHQLKKWRKKYKFEIKKRRQRKELKREKEFQAGLIHQIKQAEVFNPEQYVVDKLMRASQVPIIEKYKRPPVTSNIIYHPGFPDENAEKK